MIRYLLVTEEAASYERLAALLNGPGDAALEFIPWRPFERMVEREGFAGRDAPDVVLLGSDHETAAALAAGDRLLQVRADVSAVLFADPSPDLLREALRAGIRDVVSPNASDHEVREALDRAGRAAIQRRAYVAGLAQETRPSGRVITVLSPKGGSGKTVVATNLAVALGAAAPRQVALVDADLQLGAVAQALGLEPNRTIADVPRGGETLDPEAVIRALTGHVSQVAVLAAPDSVEQGEGVPAEHLAAVVKQLALSFSYVVVDTPAGLSEGTLSVLEISTDAVVVAGTDVPSVRQLRTELDALQLVGLTPRLHLVVNRADSRVGLEVKDVEGVVGVPASAELPSTRLVPLALNRGVAIVLDQPRSRIARELQRLAGQFAEVGSKDRQRWRVRT